MGGWSRELVRRAFEWQYSRGPERTTFSSIFHSSFSPLEKDYFFPNTCCSCIYGIGVCMHLWTERE